MNITPEPCARHFLPEAIEELRRQIADHGGNEVFLVGRPAEGVARIQSVEVFCRGNAVSVPALLDVAQEGDVVIHNHPSGVLLPSEADLALASQYGEKAVGFMIVNNSAEQVLVVVKPFARRVRQVVATDQLEAFLGASGLLARRLPGYESRPGQLEMSRLVLDAYNVDGIAVVEAGTGTGKSLAYLVPAALYALANRESVVVATHTINLQEQLYTKDAPLLTALPPFKDLRVALLKGRSNYLCNRKFEYFRQNPLEIFSEEQLQLLASLDDWYERSEEGTRSELTAPMPEDLWDRLAADEEDCTRVKCPHYDQCFFFKARREAAGAHILIVNQHLLMADLSVRLAVKDYKRALVLPPYRRIVLDEAHHLEDVATSFISGKVNTRGLLRILGRMLTARNLRRGHDERKGLLILLQRRLSQAGLEEAQVGPLLRLMAERLEPAVDVLRQLTRDHLRELAAQVRAELTEQGIPSASSLRVREPLMQTPLWQEVIMPRLSELESSMMGLATHLSTLLERLDALPERFKVAEQQPLLELAALRPRLTNLQARLREFLTGGENLVRWIEIEPNKQFEPTAALCTSPIEVAEMLAQLVFDPLKTCVLTSATLSTGGRFDYFRERVGLDQVPTPRVKSLVVNSPFDYAKQVYFGIPTDFPEPRDRTYQQRLIEMIEEALLCSQGGAFVLFTSYSLLNSVYEAIQAGGRIPYPLLKHGEEPRHRLLDRFKTSNHSVLFGTDSFWEGVDVQGEALRLVIITRLPFQVPSEPVQEARAERVKERGLDPFNHISLPQAIIKFKQGFGRLIRHKEDRGVVLVLDQRIAGKGYGRQFLASVQGVQPMMGPGNRILGQMRQFFSGASLEEMAPSARANPAPSAPPGRSAGAHPAKQEPEPGDFSRFAPAWVRRKL